ncbi:MAG TPA: chitobiase/beta-hexosaminidase C-terminal domain-containing protein [Terracidiphilus sp.]|nr:chitobiase/beta-hexosaminidase C-terminal domain-containing protein [Terracidiphilus sp.]
MLRKFAALGLLAAGLLALAGPGLRAQTPTPVPVLTWRYDLTHAGQNTDETALTPQNVNVNSFGKLFALPVDSTVYAQPLYVPNIKMSDGNVHNVLFVCTENDSIYAFDADSNGGADANPIWQISLLTAAHGAGAGATAVPWSDTGSPDVAPTIGITGTPTINPATNTLYVVAATKENGTYYSRLHAINIVNGQEESGSPVVVTATVAGTGNGSSGGQLTFSPLWENQRTALDYYNGYVYFGYAAHGDNGPWHGWVFAYNATTLAQSAALCLSPNDVGAGVWGAGAGLPIDDDASGGRMFIVTGNGAATTTYPPFNESSDLGESVIDLSLANGGLTPTDAFTSFNYETLNSHDWDLGSGGILMVPDQQGAYPHELVQGGKEGRIVVLNRDNLGGYAAGASSNTNALQDITGITTQGEGFWNTPAYWNGNVYLWPEDGSPMLFQLNSGVMDTTPASTSSITAAFPSPSFSISSNGTADGIAWAVRSDQFNTDGPAVLYAWDANDLSQIIYESDTDSSRDAAGPANKFSIPVVTNGKVYVAAHGEVDVYGLLNGQPVAAAPTIAPNGGTFASTTSITLSTTTADANIYYTLNGTTPTPASTLYTGPITLTTDSTLDAIASAAGYIQSSVSTATFTFSDQTPLLTFSPAAGTYLNAQQVTITDADTNAKIYYTTNGATPSASSTLYTGPIAVAASETIQAIAIDPSLQNSDVESAAYVIQNGGTSINFGMGFSSTAGLTLNGSAAADDDTRLQLTDGQLWQASSVFWSAPINITNFTTNFEFQLSNAQGNGFTFTIQNQGPTALGGDSAGLGYQGIQNSVAVKFNFYNYEDEGSDSTGFYTDGEPPVTPTIDVSPSGIELGSGDGIQAQLTYDGTTLTLSLDDLVTGDTFTTSQQINIPQIVGGDTAYVGFTGGSGGLTSSQKILTWTYTTTPAGTSGAGSFQLSSSPVTAFPAGATATSTVTVTPSGGFTGMVSLGCAVTASPAGAADLPTCTVTQPAAIASGAVMATLTVNTTAPTATAFNGSLRRIFVAGGGASLATLLFFCLPIRRRKWQSFFSLLVLVILAAVVGGCASSSGISTGGQSSGGTTAGAYTITVTGTSGSASASTAVSLTVQ